MQVLLTFLDVGDTSHDPNPLNVDPTCWSNLDNDICVCVFTFALPSYRWSTYADYLYLYFFFIGVK